MATLGALTIHVNYLLRGENSSMNTPYWLKHTAGDAIANAAESGISNAMLSSLSNVDSPPLATLAAFVGNCVFETGQGLLQHFGAIESGFDWIDFPAYAIGSISYLGLDLSAKILYYSGLTKPIYQVLGIQDRRVIGIHPSLL